MSHTIISCPQQPSRQPTTSQRPKTAEALLRDLAFVFHATQLVKKAMIASEPVISVA